MIATPAGYTIDLSVSRDASRIAYDVVSGDEGGGHSDVYLWSATPLLHLLPDDGADRGYPRLSVDGRRLWYSTGPVVMRSFYSLQTEGLARFDPDTGAMADVFVGRDVGTLRESDFGNGPELLFLERPALGRDFIEAWPPA